LSKNATEGMASPLRIPFFTAFLLLGHVLPLPLAVMAYEAHHSNQLQVTVLAMVLGYLMRFFGAWRYGESWRGAFLHPLGAMVLLVLEWWALLCKVFGVRAVWKQRAYRMG
jgi:hypothetical protein